jgi:hypothetical protein
MFEGVANHLDSGAISKSSGKILGGAIPNNQNPRKSSNAIGIRNLFSPLFSI